MSAFGRIMERLDDRDRRDRGSTCDPERPLQGQRRLRFYDGGAVGD
jgi:hypothetical protein